MLATQARSLDPPEEHGWPVLPRVRAPQVRDLAGLGIMLVDPHGQVLVLNRAARQILAANRGLSLRSGTLYASTPLATCRLRGLLQRAAAGCAEPGSEAVGKLSLAGPPQQRPLHLAVVGLDGCEPRAHGALALVLLTYLERPIPPLNEVLQQIYGLTPAEARLASALAGGHALDDTAHRLGISRHTARSQLKQVFAKTGVRRQSELVFLLARGPASLVTPAGP